MKNEEYPTMNFAKCTQFGIIVQNLQTVLPELGEIGTATGNTKEE